jgi:hypothetical protein
MSGKVVSSLLVLILLLAMVGCTAHMHTIGAGPQGKGMELQRQWYVLWGLVPINTVDTAQMAGGAANYEIKTEQAPLDIVINIFTSYITVVSRTVTVTK